MTEQWVCANLERIETIELSPVELFDETESSVPYCYMETKI